MFRMSHILQNLSTPFSKLCNGDFTNVLKFGIEPNLSLTKERATVTLHLIYPIYRAKCCTRISRWRQLSSCS